MAKHYSTYFGIKHEALISKGVFDACVDIDLKMHVDPILLKKCQIVEFKNAYNDFLNFFARFIAIAPKVKQPNTKDIFFKRMVQYYTLCETPNTGLGYSNGHTHGHGISGQLSIQLATSTYEIVKAGITDPRFFGWMQLIEDNMGADRISDMTIAILQGSFLSYTQRVAKELGLNTIDYTDLEGCVYSVPFYNNNPILFIPMDLLTDLPVANSRDEIDDVCSYNIALKRRISKIIGVTWQEYNKYSKDKWKNILLQNTECYKESIELYDALCGISYDFENDSQEVYYEVKMMDVIKKFSFHNVVLANKTPSEEIYELSKRIIIQFKHIVEDRRASELFYRKKRTPDETDWQLLLFAIADTYKDVYGLNAHISREPNPGVGEIDFQITRGSEANTVIEIKRSGNADLLHGYREQLSAYMNAEKADHGIFIVIMEDDSIETIKNIIATVQKDMKDKGEYIPEVFYINGMRQPSASNSSYTGPHLN